MSLTKFYVKFFEISIITLVLLILLTILLSISIGFITKNGIRVPQVAPLVGMQRTDYFGGSKNIWQYQSECVEVGGAMIYQPKTGVCNFDNIEFNTQLNFGGDGRKNNFEFDYSLPTIAVLGDSHAIGWGVADDEIFSAQL